MKILRPFLLGQLLLTCLLLPLGAQTVTYQFTGTIKSWSTLGVRDYFGIGSTYTASVVYDPAAAATYSGPAAYGGQESTYPVVSMALTVHTLANGDWTATATSPLRNVSVIDDLYGDYLQFSAVAVSAPSAGGMTANTFNLVFGGSNALIDSTLVPATIDAAAWDPYNFATQTYMKIYLDGTKEAIFRISSVTTPSAVPEPSTYAALAGLAVLGFAAWHRRRA